jgi:hypothetical protein
MNFGLDGAILLNPLEQIMIHVDLKDEPDIFDKLVRQPGFIFLTKTPTPTTKQWNQHSLWRSVLKELHHSYDGICAYSCHWIPYDTGADTTEHFLPKSKYPNSAYDWSNYRLVCSTLNGRKKDFEDVLDPFNINDGDFIIDFPSLFIKPSKDLTKDYTQSVRNTIIRLGLNDEDTCLKSRERYIKQYCLRMIDFRHLVLDAPFIAKELQRQNLVDSIREIMDYSLL